MSAALNGHDASNGLLAGSDPLVREVEQPGTNPDAGERASLERSLAATHGRINDARADLARREASLKEALRDELIESRRRLEEMDRQHDERVAAIRAEADAAIEAILRGATEEGR